MLVPYRLSKIDSVLDSTENQTVPSLDSPKYFKEKFELFESALAQLTKRVLFTK